MSEEQVSPPPSEAGQQQPPYGVKTGDITLQAAQEPFPQPEDPPNTPPWETAEFKRKVLGAGFPGSPGSDVGFLAALYKFTGGKIEDFQPTPSPAPSQSEAPPSPSQ